MTIARIWVVVVIVVYLIGGFLGEEVSNIAIIIWTLLNTSLLLEISDKLVDIEKKIKEKE